MVKVWMCILLICLSLVATFMFLLEGKFVLAMIWLVIAWLWNKNRILAIKLKELDEEWERLQSKHNLED